MHPYIVEQKEYQTESLRSLRIFYIWKPMGRNIMRRYSRNVSPQIPRAIPIIRGLAEGENKDYLKLTEISLGGTMARLDREGVALFKS